MRDATSVTWTVVTVSAVAGSSQTSSLPRERSETTTTRAGGGGLLDFRERVGDGTTTWAGGGGLLDVGHTRLRRDVTRRRGGARLG